MAFLKECKYLNLNPAPLGLIKRKGKQEEINLDHSQLGKAYIKAVTKSMQHLKPRDVRIKNIKENEGSILGILDSLKDAKEMAKLDLRNNTVSSRSIGKV